MTDDTDKNRDNGELPLITDQSQLEHPDEDDGDQAEAPSMNERTPEQEKAIKELRRQFKDKDDFALYEEHDWPDGQVVVVTRHKDVQEDLPVMQFHVRADGSVQRES